jgi:GH24 family phage-related lysozyme (muramidase)
MESAFMKVSAAGRNLIASFEGLSMSAYRCPASVWTIGYGHTQNVNPGDRVTPAEADALLDADLLAWADGVEKLLTVPTSQHEFDAMVSLAFNIGLAGFAQSSVLRFHNACDKLSTARVFSLWNKANVQGQLQPLAGLTARRAREAAWYLTPDAPGVKDMPQAVAPPPSAVSSKTVIAGGVAVASGAATVADQVTQASTTIGAVTTSLQGVLKLGALGLSIIALCAVGFMLWRYVQKRRRGEVISS